LKCKEFSALVIFRNKIPLIHLACNNCVEIYFIFAFFPNISNILLIYAFVLLLEILSFFAKIFYFLLFVFFSGG